MKNCRNGADHVKKSPRVSIIIRSKNEERWITPCLRSVFEQTCKDFEVVLVDNRSDDKTVEKARQFPGVRILNIDKFLPGKSINMGVHSTTGEYVVMLSAHCIPKDEHWLEHL